MDSANILNCNTDIFAVSMNDICLATVLVYFYNNPIPFLCCHIEYWSLCQIFHIVNGDCQKYEEVLNITLVPANSYNRSKLDSIELC